MIQKNLREEKREKDYKPLIALNGLASPTQEFDE